MRFQIAVHTGNGLTHPSPLALGASSQRESVPPLVAVGGAPGESQLSHRDLEIAHADRSPRVFRCPLLEGGPEFAWPHPQLGTAFAELLDEQRHVSGLA